MNLENVSDEVWQKLAQSAVQASEKGLDVNTHVGKFFYNHIYSSWSKGQTDYTNNQDDDIDAGWDQLAIEWEKIEKSKQALGNALGDDSVGRAIVQGGTKPGDIKMARLWEKYNQGKGDRFQFVVSMGGGMVLFNRMRRACQGYIIERLSSKAEQSVIRGWKVFSEAGGAGRSDSCVVYLACKWNDRALTEVITSYIWPNVKDLVDADFSPIGFYSIDNKPLWAMPMPNKDKEISVLKIAGKGSAGGLMSKIFGMAFEKSAPTPTSSIATLVKQAKEHAKKITTDLYS